VWPLNGHGDIVKLFNPIKMCAYHVVGNYACAHKNITLQIPRLKSQTHIRTYWQIILYLWNYKGILAQPG